MHDGGYNRFVHGGQLLKVLSLSLASISKIIVRFYSCLYVTKFSTRGGWDYGWEVAVVDEIVGAVAASYYGKSNIQTSFIVISNYIAIFITSRLPNPEDDPTQSSPTSRHRPEHLHQRRRRPCTCRQGKAIRYPLPHLPHPRLQQQRLSHGVLGYAFPSSFTLPLHPSIPSSSRRLLVFFLIDNIQAVASDSPRCVQVTQCTGATLTHIPTSSKKEESGAIRAASLFPVWVFSPFTSEPSSKNISDGVDVGYVLLPIQRAIQVM